MENTTTIIVAMVAAISAILAPILTALLNNRHQYKIRKLELLQAERIKAIQDFLSACSNYITSYTKPTKDEYYRRYGEIFLHVNKKHWKSIEDLNADIENGQARSASEKLTKVCQALSEEMKL